MAAPNLAACDRIIAGKARLALTTSPTTVVSNAAASNKTYKIHKLRVANVDGTNDADVTIDVYNSSTATHIVKSLLVPANSSVLILTKDDEETLLEGDSIRATASAAGDLELLCDWTEWDVIP